MTDSPESTPHITKARKHLVDAVCELREARLSREAEPVRLVNLSGVARSLDDALEELENR